MAILFCQGLRRGGEFCRIEVKKINSAVSEFGNFVFFTEVCVFLYGRYNL